MKAAGNDRFFLSFILTPIISMKIKDISMRMTMRALCMFEHLTGKPYSRITLSEDDMTAILYCTFLTANNQRIDYKTFKELMAEEKTAKEIGNKYYRENMYISQFNCIKANDHGEEKDDDNALRMSDVAAALVINCGLSPKYVMDEMELWEIEDYVKCNELKMKNEMVDKRFWTYLTIAPQIDTKKIKSPEKLMTFPWEEKDKKEKAERELKNNMFAARNLIGKEMDWIK